MNRIPSRNWYNERGGAVTILIVIAILVVIGGGLFVWVTGSETDNTQSDVEKKAIGVLADSADNSDSTSNFPSPDVLRIVRYNDGEPERIEAPDLVRIPREESDDPVQIRIQHKTDFDDLDGVTLQVPAGSDLAVEIENDSDVAYNAYLSAGDGTGLLSSEFSLEPLIKANTEETKTFPIPSAGEFQLQIEDESGENILEVTVEVIE